MADPQARLILAADSPDKNIVLQLVSPGTASFWGKRHPEFHIKHPLIPFNHMSDYIYIFKITYFKSSKRAPLAHLFFFS
jgi:hypothetical protein